MIRPARLCVLAGLLSSAAAAGTTNGLPFVTMRMTSAVSRAPEKTLRVIEENASRPGSVDEYWFAHCAGDEIDVCRERFRSLKPFREACVRHGIRFGFQQGVTLGHGPMDMSAPGRHRFTDAAWQVDAAGRTMKMFCPRSPEVLAYEEDYVAALCEELQPVSLWLDDDLRLSYFKADGCFCDRCLAEFNRGRAKPVTRAELVRRLSGGAAKDAIRREWIDFCADSLAAYGAAARRGADRGCPSCMVAYQSIDPEYLKAGRDYLPLLKALAGGKGGRTAIRVGSCNYGEDLGEMMVKLHAVAREAERCRAAHETVAWVSYELETYMREILHKSAEAQLVESALALAVGCDALTEYRWDPSRDEPLTDYAEFASALAAWRGYLERVASVTRRTRLGGLARFVGSDCDLTTRYTVRDGNDAVLAGLGVPVSVAESRVRTWYVDAQSLEEWRAGDEDILFANGATALVDAPSWKRFRELAGETGRKAVADGRAVAFDLKHLQGTSCHEPTDAERRALLDALDALKGETLPVRMERTHRFCLYPRTDADGRTVAVTVFNGSTGKAPPSALRIRRPAGKVAAWVRPCETDMLAYVTPGEGDEIVVHIPALPARQVATVELLGACPPTVGDVARVCDEPATLPPYAPTRPAWNAGYRPLATVLWECAVRQGVIADSVEAIAADGRKLVRNVDFKVEPAYGGVSLIGAAAKDPRINPVKLSYSYRQERLDAVIRTREGAVDVRRGIPAAANPAAPAPGPEETALGNFWIRGAGRADNGAFFPCDGTPVPRAKGPGAARTIPKTLAKLKSGQPVRILAWGDSVTACTYRFRDAKWQDRFLARLRAAFPTNEITLVSNGWGGRTLRDFLNAPAGSEHDFTATVLDVKPDLVVSEFVNEPAYADYAAFCADFGKVRDAFRARGIEWVMLTPHYITASWMKAESAIGSDDDPRPYVAHIRRFAAENGIGLADASLRWGHLWREGIPYQTLFVNGINHPDDRGLGFFVDALMDFMDR